MTPAALGMGSVKTSSSRRTPKRGIQKSRKVFDKAMAGYLAESFDDQYDQELEWEGMPAPLELAMSAEDAALALVNLSGSLSTDFG